MPLQRQVVAGRCSCRTRCSGRARRRGGAPCPGWPSRPTAAAARSAASTCQLPGVGQLLALRREELDAVVVERVVRGADHHAQVQPQRARQVGHAGRGQRAGQQHVDAGRGEAGLQRGLEHVAGDARVLADQHRRPRRRSRLQHAAHGMAQAQHEVGRDRRLADRAADAVGAEIFSAHRHVVSARCDRRACHCGHRPRRRQTFSASTVAATSCTRTMRAPRCTAASAAATLAASALAHRPAGERAERRLARPAHQQRLAQRQQLALARAAARGCAPRVLPKPKPGSSTMRSRRDAGRAQRRARARAGSRAPRPPRRRSRARPAWCAARPACASGTRRSSGARPPPPARPGARSARDVVDDVDAQRPAPRASPRACWCPPTPARPACTAPRSTGSTRASSSSQRHRRGARAGRLAADVEDVGALAPAAARNARARAGASACRPPSEKESGVTLTMPITRGRLRSIAKAGGLPDAWRARRLQQWKTGPKPRSWSIRPSRSGRGRRAVRR